MSDPWLLCEWGRSGVRPVADGVANARKECCVASVAKRVWVGSRRVRGARRPARVCAFFPRVKCVWD